MAMQAYAVRLEDGEVRSVDGTPLPRHANALLVVLPEPGTRPEQDEWLRPFREYLEALTEPPAADLNDLSDQELNDLVHSAR